MPDTYVLSGARTRIGLTQLSISPVPDMRRSGIRFDVSGSEQGPRFAALAAQAAVRHFEMFEPPRIRRAAPTPLPAAFEDEHGCLRLVYKEIVVRFAPKTKAKTRDKILAKYGFKIRARNSFERSQVVVAHPSGKHFGAELCTIANDWAEADEVRFATPNFVSEYVRSARPRVPMQQWHLWNRGKNGQTKDEDVRIRDAWKVTRGDPGIIVAVVDDGVDLSHPNLRYRFLRNPDPNNPDDTVGRDFVLPASHPEHYDPRPKVFTFPYQRLAGNDIHGTPCAGIIAADGRVRGIIGAAPRCRILAVKVFHADDMASDASVADAIRYSARFADIVSCSWGGPPSTDIELAVEDAGEARGGLGSAVFCAAGNDGNRNRVDFPAAYSDAIAVGASTDIAGLAGYSNAGREVSVVAPSSGGIKGIYTTDVSEDNRGFNVGDTGAGDQAGLFTNDFGGTSSATPLAAAVAALCLSVNEDLDRGALQSVLEQTADKIGGGYVNGHSKQFGYGRVNAANAVAMAQSLS